MSLGSGALSAAHSGLWRLGRGLAADAGSNVGAAGALKLGSDPSRSTGRGQVVVEVGFKGARDGFKPDE